VNSFDFLFKKGKLAEQNVSPFRTCSGIHLHLGVTLVTITLTLRPSPARFLDILSGRPPGRPQATWKQPSEFGLRPPSGLRATKPTINVGKKLYRAADIPDLPEKLSHSPFPCRYCGQWVATHEETPHGIFFEAPEEEIKHSTIGPAAQYTSGVGLAIERVC
jgi:hypothetical protein